MKREFAQFFKTGNSHNFSRREIHSGFMLNTKYEASAWVYAKKSIFKFLGFRFVASTGPFACLSAFTGGLA